MKLGTILLCGLFACARALLAEPEVTLRVLALDRPQAAAEQQLADKAFTAQTGIKVVLQTNSATELHRKLTQVARDKAAEYDLLHYDPQWLGQLVGAGALEQLDAPAFLGTNAPADSPVEWTEAQMLAAATNQALTLAIFRPEMTYRLAKFPTIERDLARREFDKYAATPVFGLPWSVAAEILAFRVDLVDSAFARVQPSVAEFYNTHVAPNWTNEWSAFGSAGRLVQLVHENVKAAGARGAASRDAVLRDVLPMLWAFGGELWKEEKRQAAGVLNSASNVKALHYYCEWNSKSKTPIVPAGSVTWGEAETAKALADGTIAAALLGPVPAWKVQNDKTVRAAGRLEFAMAPGVVAVVVQAKPSKDPGGAVTGALDSFQAETTIRRATLSGCVGVGISSFSKQKPAAWRYLEWLFSRQTQTALIFEKDSNFVSARKDLAAESRSATPVNRVVVESFDLGAVRSPWNVPEAAQLDAILALECNLAFRGVKTPQAALDAAAKEIQAVLDEGSAR